MKIIATENYQQMGYETAQIIANLVKTKPDCVLGLATGSTPIKAYEYLKEMHKEGSLDFKAVKTVNLDEYCGIEDSHDQSYRYFMNQQLFKEINIDLNNTNVPNGMAQDVDAECQRYEGLIDSLGGIDLQLLGIGHNGHIGFNEPADDFSQVTHKAKLDEKTINANSRFFERIDDVPKFAITMGIKTIMNANQIVLIASGIDKAEILDKALFGPITPKVPASVLQLHKNVVIIADEDALSLIKQNHNI